MELAARKSWLFPLLLFSLIFHDLISASYHPRKPQFPGKPGQAPSSSSLYFYVILSFWLTRCFQKQYLSLSTHTVLGASGHRFNSFL